MFKHAVLALAVVAAGFSALARAEVRGAGSTAAAPVYRVWSAGYAASSGITLNYDAVGSGEGIKRIREGSVDFGASDVPLSSAEAAKALMAKGVQYILLSSDEGIIVKWGKETISRIRG